jgi:hypothetical protein
MMVFLVCESEHFVTAVLVASGSSQEEHNVSEKFWPHCVTYLLVVKSAENAVGMSYKLSVVLPSSPISFVCSM